MQYIFLGIERRSGSFTNDRSGEVVEFDNGFANFAVVGDRRVAGKGISQMKIKGKDFESVFGYSLDEFLSCIDEFLDKPCRLDFAPNVNGSVDLISVEFEQ